MKKTNHILHGIITLFFFPWIIVWVAMYLRNSQINKTVLADDPLLNLTRLKNLLDINAITQDEYDVKRQQILKNI